MNLRVSLGLLCALAVALSSCNRELDPVAPYLNEIYPIQDGKARIYHVVDTVYATTNSQLFEVRTYFKKEEASGTEEDLLGREVSKLYISQSPDTLPADVYRWTFSELWTQYAGEGYAERIEGNVRYLVLRLPPYEFSVWNGNLYNNGDVETYQYMNLDTTVTVQGNTYEHCVYVLQIPYRRPVANQGGTYFVEEHAYEIYAPKIGKIVRYTKLYEEQNGVIQSYSRVYREELVTHTY
jgi:hypothetical protein